MFLVFVKIFVIVIHVKLLNSVQVEILFEPLHYASKTSSASYLFVEWYLIYIRWSWGLLAHLLSNVYHLESSEIPNSTYYNTALAKLVLMGVSITNNYASSFVPNGRAVRANVYECCGVPKTNPPPTLLRPMWKTYFHKAQKTQ